MSFSARGPPSQGPTAGPYQLGAVAASLPSLHSGTAAHNWAASRTTLESRGPIARPESLHPPPRAVTAADLCRVEGVPSHTGRLRSASPRPLRCSQISRLPPAALPDPSSKSPCRSRALPTLPTGRLVEFVVQPQGERRLSVRLSDLRRDGLRGAGRAVSGPSRDAN